MKKIICTIGVFLFFLHSGQAQELGSYQYVRVPDKFEFLKEENQYQLNALTAFLFDKFNFTALYKEPDPSGVDPCEILTANVHNESGLFRTKVYVTLEDCKNQIVFTSETGVSREKDFKRSYHEALRNAFKSVAALEHEHTGEVIVDTALPREEMDSLEATDGDKVVKNEQQEKMKNTSEGGEAAAHRFTNGSQEYFLKETSAGFELYKKGQEEIFGRLIRSGGGENYLYSSGDISGNAFFNGDGDLVVEYLDTRSGQLITVVYKKA